MSNANSLCQAVLSNRSPLAPIATDVESRLQTLDGIRAVIFDIYGTLVVSGSGDVGSANDNDPADQMSDAFAAIGVHPPVLDLPSYGGKLRDVITRTNAARQSDLCPKPEVDIVAVWRQMLVEVGLDDLAKDTKRVVQLTAEYECRANPTWPMPDARALLMRLAESGLGMGIVSNAQHFTLSLVQDLKQGSEQGSEHGTGAEDSDLRTVGFDLDLCVFSNRFRQSKPGPRLFDALCDSLRRRSITPAEAVYVGNDMLNDVFAASQAGLRTAWFAGDARSCRPRSDDPRCQDLQPDVVLTDLMQLLICLSMK